MNLPTWITYEPAVWLTTGSGIVAATVVLLVSFGVAVTPDQKAAILALAALIIPILGGVIVRTQVTPVAKLTAMRLLRRQRRAASAAAAAAEAQANG